MALANRCKKHETPVDIYQYKKEGEIWTVLLCKKCDAEGDPNITDPHKNINKAVDEWNKMNPIENGDESED